MKFNKALELMKNGIKVKLPSWIGYWLWDEDKKTIMMYCKDGEVLDIRETDRVEYTLSNILSDEWVVADDIIGDISINTFNFGEAIKYLKRGLKVARQGWNGKGMYLRYVNPYSDTAFTVIETESVDGTLLPYIATKTADNGFVPWLASQTDMLSEDWIFVEEVLECQN